MTKRPEITEKKFELLLNWLDEDREAAAEKYASLHRRLVQIFLARKAFPAEELADQTINVVLQKIDCLVNEYEGDPRLYFYDVAHKIFHESLRKPKSEPLNDNIIKKEVEEEIAPRIECLRECLQKLPPEKRKIFIAYYDYEKQNKIENHKKLAQNLEVDLNALRTRVYRIKLDLENCIRECVRKKTL
jgi:DNA-directed RNA polymerase specialized sigma24 family protein